MTKPKPWPRDAAEARDRAAEELSDIGRQARFLLRPEKLTQTEIVRLGGIIIQAASTGLRHLERVGAQTRPE